jgi:L-ribulokinase
VSSYVIGVDFGTGSGRAVLIDTSDGRELATSVYQYANGVIEAHLPAPDDDVGLGPEWALQDPEDYIRTFQHTVPAIIAEASVDAADVVGIGIDFTACTMLPTTTDGTPLSSLPQYRREPHAWVKLWKHHAAQPQADRINDIARERGEPWLDSYGGKISSEWFYSKALQILDEAPDVYQAADRLVEAADWVIWRLTGQETRNSCTAGYKAIWSKSEGFPGTDYFGALDPRFANVVDEKMSRVIHSIGDRAGELTAEAAGWTGLLVGTAVAVANVDAHVSVPAATVTSPGRMVAIMGTSICHVVLSDRPAVVEGMCGVVEDGVLPGLYGFEAGQPAVGDIFAWFLDNAVPQAYHEEADRLGVDVHAVLEMEAAQLAPGQSGLVGLDWWNGNRSVLVDTDLSGVILGMTLATRASEIYRALIEATAFGTRMIVESFEESGVAVNEIVACGGLPERNRLLMQIYADVTKRTISVAASSQTPALGSAMFAAVASGAAAGGYDSIEDASERMAHLRDERYVPDQDAATVYDELFAEYVALHDYFGRGPNDVLKRLRAIRDRATAAGREVSPT